MNIYSFLNVKASTVFAICLSVLVALIFVCAVIMLWWTEIKKRTVKDFFKSIGGVFKGIGDKISPNKPVKTVYSDKSRNFSGTEFLPVPAKAPTKEYSYEFVGWDKNNVDENGNTVAKPIYIQTVNTCRVNVFDDDGETLLKSTVTEYGAGIDVSDLHPSKPESKEFTYEFVGWDKETSCFYKNENVYAVYKAHPKKFSYTFFDDDGKTIISQTNAIYGTPILAPEPPKKDDLNVKFAYYKGFEEGMILDRDISFTAVYTKSDGEVFQPKPEVSEAMKKQSFASFESDRLEVFGAGEKSLSKPKKKQPQVSESTDVEVNVFNLAGNKKIVSPSAKPEVHLNSEVAPAAEKTTKTKVKKLKAKTEITDPEDISTNIRVLGIKKQN